MATLNDLQKLESILQKAIKIRVQMNEDHLLQYITWDSSMHRHVITVYDNSCRVHVCNRGKTDFSTTIECKEFRRLLKFGRSRTSPRIIMELPGKPELYLISSRYSGKLINGLVPIDINYNIDTKFYKEVA